MILPSTNRFEIGQIVKHLRYKYRGIIVEFDDTCQATDDWYRSNQTQPSRNQPWYHVLVDGASHMTYVAESNLDNEPNQGAIKHPLINHFFQRDDQGLYQRNDKPFVI